MAKKAKASKVRKPGRSPFTLEQFIAKYGNEVERRVWLFNIRDVEEVKWDFFERIMEQKCFEKYREDKIRGWDSRPSIHNFERYIFHILRTFLINRSKRQRMIDGKIVSVESLAVKQDDDDTASEPFYGGVEDAPDASKAPFSLEDILDTCHIFPPRMYREVEGVLVPISVETVARLYAEGYTDADIGERLGISPFMLSALLADLRVVASMLQVRIRGWLGSSNNRD